MERFTEFLRLFVSTHLGRLASNNNFPMLEFLALLHKYTFHQVQFSTFHVNFGCAHHSFAAKVIDLSSDFCMACLIRNIFIVDQCI